MKRLYSSILIYSLAPQIPKVASLLILRWTTPHLSPVDYGIFGTLFAFDGMLSAFRDLGVNVLLTRSYFAYPKRWKVIWQQLVGLMMGWGVVYGLIQVLLLFFIIPKEAIENRFWIILMIVLPSVLLDRTISFSSLLLQNERRVQYIGGTTVASGLITVIANYILIVVFKMGYMGMLLAPVIGKVVQYLFLIYPFWFQYNVYPIFAYRKRFILSNLKVMLPTIPHYYSAYLLNTSDRVVMNTLKVPQADIGLYNVAYTMGNYILTLTDTVGKAIAPINAKLWFKYTEDAKLKRRDLIFFIQSLFLILSFVLCIWMREVFQFLLRNPAFQPAYPFAIIIIMAYNYRPIYWGVMNAILYEKKTKFAWRISFVAGISNLLMNFTLIPLLGFKVAAITTFVSLMIMGFSGYFHSAYTSLNDVNFYPIRWLLIMVLSTVAAYLLRDIDILYKIGITVVSLVATFQVFRHFVPKLKEIEF